MLIAIIGQSCTGKSTLAEQLRKDMAATVYTGKDFLRLAKNPTQAGQQFEELLSGAVTGENVIWVISEKPHLALLPEGAVKILMTAPLDTIKERFRSRMKGNLPKPVEDMLERNYGIFDQVENCCHYNGDYATLLATLLATLQA